MDKDEIEWHYLPRVVEVDKAIFTYRGELYEFERIMDAEPC